MTFGLVILEVCDANKMSQPELFDLEETFPGVSVLENSCMNQCELCARQPYVFVNDQIVSDPESTNLLEKIKKEISRILENYKIDT
jgi:uncharacterized protein YuzB (UPF0349 family)